jgi:leader peptidase (prepilin peptidase)/N-methyltransferase
VGRRAIIGQPERPRQVFSAPLVIDRLATGEAAAWGAVAAAPFIGSFLGVLIRRLPEGRPVARGRSICEGCGQTLAPRDLVPLLSWLLNRGRCRFCGRPIGWFPPAVELAALAVALIAVAADSGGWVWLDCLLGWWLLTLAWIDARHWLLPDALTLPLVLAGLGAAAAFAPGALFARALGAALGYASLRALAWLYKRARGRDGLGGGDAKLFAAAGAWVGVGGLSSVVLLAALAALAAALLLRLTGIRLTAQSAVPFGPFLALALWLVWLYGPLSL